MLCLMTVCEMFVEFCLQYVPYLSFLQSFLPLVNIKLLSTQEAVNINYPVLCIFCSHCHLLQPLPSKSLLKQLKKKSPIKWHIKVLLKQQLTITSRRNVAHFKSMLNPKVCQVYVGIQA